MISSADRLVAKRLKDQMMLRRVPIVDTIVFGSRARGDAEEDSDLDVLVIVEQLDKEVRETVRHCAWEIGFEMGLFIQTVVMSKEEVENSPQRSSLLMLAVAQEGVRI